MDSDRTEWKVDIWEGSSDSGIEAPSDRKKVKAGEGNVLSSLLENGMHAPALDIDLPCQLVESSTPGHFHLYIDKELSWDSYKALLALLVDVGIIEPGYYRAALDRGSTFLRKPGVTK